MRRPSRGTPTRGTPSRRLSAHALLVLIAVPALGAAGEWKIAREYRRPLIGGGDAETVVFRFFGGGHLTYGGASIVIANENGDVVPSRVLRTSRGGETWVAFNARRGKGRLAIYYGGRSGGYPSGGWRPKLSLVLYTMALPRGALESYKPIASALRRGDIQGMSFVDNVWHGLNPHGPDDNYASAYIGSLKIHKAGTYKFFTASDEASFVLINDRPVCSWPGRHDARRGQRGQHGGSIHLGKGEHKLEYYHAEVDGEQCMMLGWAPPGEKGWKVVPREAFVHTPWARAEAPERRANAPLAAFIFGQDDQLLHGKNQFTRMSFANRCRHVPKGARTLWDFGDGVEFEGRETQHVYVGAGPFTCRLQIADEKGKPLDRFAVAVPIEAAVKNFTILDTQAVGQYVRVIARSDCSKIPASSMDALWEIVETEEDIRVIQPFVETYVRRFGVKGPSWHAADRLALAYSIEEPEKAVKLYAMLAANAPTKHDAARVQMERIELVLHKLKVPERAAALAQGIRKTRGGLEARIAAVKLGDVYRAQGKFKEAEDAYRKAQQITYASMDRRIIAVRQGGYLETAAAHVAHGHLRAAREALVMWEIEHPIGKLSGDLILMTARYFDALGEPERALAELQALVHLNPLTPYLPDVELLMARAYRKLGEHAKARELFDKVMREYPKSRAARQAQRE